jgi:hypothetical protein
MLHRVSKSQDGEHFRQSGLGGKCKFRRMYGPLPTRGQFGRAELPNTANNTLRLQ